MAGCVKCGSDKPYKFLMLFDQLGTGQGRSGCVCVCSDYDTRTSSKGHGHRITLLLNIFMAISQIPLNLSGWNLVDIVYEVSDSRTCQPR